MVKLDILNAVGLTISEMYTYMPKCYHIDLLLLRVGDKLPKEWKDSEEAGPIGSDLHLRLDFKTVLKDILNAREQWNNT